MLVKRTVVISAQRRFCRAVVPALAGTGSGVDILDDVQAFVSSPQEANLIVYHMPAESDEEEGKLRFLMDHVEGETKVVVVIPDTDLDRMVRWLRCPGIDNVVVGKDLGAATVSGIASRHLFGGVFGIEKYLPWGVRIYSMLVGDYQEKTVAITTVTDFAESLGVRRKYLQSIEKVIDELLMNALYDAPVDRNGQMLFADVTTKDRVEVQLEQKALLQYACDGERFAVAVTDNFGTLEKDVVLQYLHKCLHRDDQIDKKDSGAGLGLYIVTNSVSEYIINLHPGVATEAICLFDLRAPRPLLTNFGFFKETIDAMGKARPTARGDVTGEQPLAAPPEPFPPVLKAALLAAAGLLLLAVLILLWTRL